jgi:hypothetical protein
VDHLPDAGSKALAWTAFFILLPVALLGSNMFARWLGVYRGTVTASPPAGPVSGHAAAGAAPAATAAPATQVVSAERHLPVPVVLAYGALAASTLVLVLLTALGAGEG